MVCQIAISRNFPAISRLCLLSVDGSGYRRINFWGPYRPREGHPRRTASPGSLAGPTSNSLPRCQEPLRCSAEEAGCPHGMAGVVYRERENTLLQSTKSTDIEKATAGSGNGGGSRPLPVCIRPSQAETLALPVSGNPVYQPRFFKMIMGANRCLRRRNIIKVSPGLMCRSRSHRASKTSAPF